MAGEESGMEEEEEEWLAVTSVSGARLSDAPVLFFVTTHKAFREELASVRRAAEEAVGSGDACRELVAELGRRLEFLKLVYSYHSAAEDEVVFLALDAVVKNVVSTYALEHKSIDDTFSSIFHRLDLLMNEDDDTPQMFRDLLFSIGTLQTMICQHMHKEEEQVFPSLTEHFTSEDQSKLVWQYMCSVPMILLEEFISWMTLFLTSEEKQDVLDCIELIIPKETKLQEVVASWIQHEGRASQIINRYGKGYQLLNGLSGFKDIDEFYPPPFGCERNEQLKSACSSESSGFEGPVKGIYIWHATLTSGFNQIIEELYQIRSSNCLSSLSSVIFQIKFIIDVLIFYSNSLDKFVHQLLRLLPKNTPSFCAPLIDEYQIKGLQWLLFREHQGSEQRRSFIELLCQELESLMKGLAKDLIFLDTEVFPSINESCAYEMQLWLIYTTLHTMPFGLLKCTITWFSAHLSDTQSNVILKCLKLGCPSVNESFTSLLHEWVHIGCSEKISSEKFRQNLEETFNGRSFYLTKQNELEINSAITMKKSVDMPSSSDSVNTNEHDIFCPSGMNLHKFSQMFKRPPPMHQNLVTFQTLESRPMNLVFYIHRALIKDMEYLISLSAKLATNFGDLAEFKNRFGVLNKFYQLHSNSEDEFAFPALESKGELKNISRSYCIDHKLDSIHFRRTSLILNQLSELPDNEAGSETSGKKYQLCLKLHETCLSMHKVLSDHIHHEEVEIFPLFRGCFSTEEEEKVVGHMLGMMKAEILQEKIPWLMAHLNFEDQNTMISLWLNVARYTKFNEWLHEWWDGMTRYNNISEAEKRSGPSPLLAADPLEVVLRYLSMDDIQSLEGGHDNRTRKEFASVDGRLSGACNTDESKFVNGGHVCQPEGISQNQGEVDEKRSKEASESCQQCQKLGHKGHPLGMDQEDLETMIRRVSCDSSLDLQKKSYIIQNLLMSRWLIKQKMSHEEDSVAIHEGEIPGQSPSYRDSLKLPFGCVHYKRNCKLFAPCCNKLYTCIRCHDDLADHSVDRKTITQMMCMKCLVIQPIGPTCISKSCTGFSMGRYYCRICKLFDDERQIYHCPYCNLCRVGKGLGIDYFHCMKCNACMSRALLVHVCREKCLEDNCPICHEYIFTSNSPVKALPCGHLMHSSCFKDYTFSHYICPICSKSLGDMQVYFGMLDALLAEEKTPAEHAGQTQIILCNDCEKRGTASFHWLYHKCSYCGSYNTRLL
ncbi:zinc ion binding [Striga hermonthica]|uniref:Zinc ion binding n=1 Tax=Striga hermonthica TaxID=68872 RepID=A0A9N7NA90_STRHE|nr:zinc ion binding [Striga hermonthica]